MRYLNDYNPIKDGSRDTADIINKAIIESIGDTLVIDDGLYLCSTIFLKSNVSIYLSRGARIKLIDDIDKLYDIKLNRKTDILVPTWEDCEYDGRPSKYFIYGKDINNFKIYGNGIIDGNEEIFYGKVTPFHIEGSFYPRVPLIYIENGKNLSFEGITLTKSGFWTLHLVGCDGVRIDSLNILNNPIFTNCDGIDPDHSKNIIIKNTNISCADDCIVIKNTEAFKKYGDSYNIDVSNCSLKSTSAAIKIGTESVSDFKNIRFKNIRIHDTNRGISLMLRDGGSIEDAIFENISIDNHLVSPINWWGRGEPISITNVKRNENTILGHINRVGFKNIDAISENGITIYGDNIKDIGLYNINLSIVKKTEWPREGLDLRPSIHNVIEQRFYDLYSKGAKNIDIMDSNFKDVLMED